MKRFWFGIGIGIGCVVYTDGIKTTICKRNVRNVCG